MAQPDDASAALARGVEPALPPPRVPISPTNVAQLLDNEQAEAKGLRQALWCGEAVSVGSGAGAAAAAPSPEEWGRVLARLGRGEQPPCRDALEDFTVGPLDPRLGLRGQRGVRVVGAAAAPASSTAGAEFSIPPNTPLLHYAGTVRAQAAFDELYQERGEANGYVFLLAGVPPGPLLALDGYDGGGLACFINDYRPNPYNDPATTAALARAEADGSAALAAGPNCRFVKVLEQGWPYLFVVSSRAIGAGEELLLDYGDEYWASRGGGAGA